MSEEERTPPVNVNLEASAKVEFSGEVPQSVMERGGHMLLDAISPFTEMGTILSENVRLFRHENIIRIFGRAKELLEKRGRKVSSTPLKFLVPFVERASCEELKNDLEESWAMLLAKASTDYDAQLIAFTNILAELGGNEITYFREVVECDAAKIRAKSEENGSDAYYAVPFRLAYYSDEQVFLSFLKKWSNGNVRKLVHGPIRTQKDWTNLGNVWKAFFRQNSGVRGQYLVCPAYTFVDQDYPDVFEPRTPLALENVALVKNYNLLLRHGLLSAHSITIPLEEDRVDRETVMMANALDHKLEFQIHYLALTRFGADFYNTCCGNLNF